MENNYCKETIEISKSYGELIKAIFLFRYDKGSSLSFRKVVLQTFIDKYKEAVPKKIRNKLYSDKEISKLEKEIKKIS